MRVWVQLTAGQGPAECAWAVPRVAEKLIAEARENRVEAEVLDAVPGDRPETARSMLIALEGEIAPGFALIWRGTVQWTARSPFRPEHKRRNWFVGVEVFEPPEQLRFDPADLVWETMRASGPGGQHVNRTESAVRVTHRPTGIQATGSEERSQHRNRALALARLAEKLDAREQAGRASAQRSRWAAHRRLERGNPVRGFREG